MKYLISMPYVYHLAQHGVTNYSYLLFSYELTQADLAVSSFNQLSVINLRRLFANKGAEFMDLQKQPEEKKAPKRRTITDTIS